jgi:hypothetical protein
LTKDLCHAAKRAVAFVVETSSELPSGDECREKPLLAKTCSSPAGDMEARPKENSI